MKGFIIFLLALATFSARAAVQIESSRVIYPSDVKSAALVIRNASAKPYLVQSWLDGEKKGEDKSSLMIVTPPLLKLQPNQAATLRFIYSGHGLPLDRESMLWVNVQEIPPRATQSNVMQLAIRTRMKLFYRPASLKISLEEAVAKIRTEYVKGGVNIINPGPLHITFSAITMKDNQGKLRKITPTMLLPFTREFIALPTGATLQKFSYINDYGGVIDSDFSQ